MEENKGIKTDEKGRFLPGTAPGPGRPPDTLEKKIEKKIIKDIVEEYKQSLAESLELIKPVLIAKGLQGDVPAIKEIHDRVMDKAKQATDVKLTGDLNINVISYGNNNTPQIQS